MRSKGERGGAGWTGQPRARLLKSARTPAGTQPAVGGSTPTAPVLRAQGCTAPTRVPQIRLARSARHVRPVRLVRHGHEIPDVDATVWREPAERAAIVAVVSGSPRGREGSERESGPVGRGGSRSWRGSRSSACRVGRAGGRAILRWCRRRGTRRVRHSRHVRARLAGSRPRRATRRG